MNLDILHREVLLDGLVLLYAAGCFWVLVYFMLWAKQTRPPSHVSRLTRHILDLAGRTRRIITLADERMSSHSASAKGSGR
jgi:hypothetical protein